MAPSTADEQLRHEVWETWRPPVVVRTHAAVTDRPMPSQQTAHVVFTLHFLPHSSCRLCYDERTHGERDRAPGREDTRWTLWRWWIR